MGTQNSAAVSRDGVYRPGGSADVTGTSASAEPTGVVSTRAGRAWVKVLPALFVLTVILVFVLQNSQSAKVSFITVSGRLPLAIALLGAAVLGALFVLALGSIRILQLRRTINWSSRQNQADRSANSGA